MADRYPFTIHDGQPTVHVYAAGDLASERKPARFWTRCGYQVPDVDENMVTLAELTYGQFADCPECFGVDHTVR